MNEIIILVISPPSTADLDAKISVDDDINSLQMESHSDPEEAIPTEKDTEVSCNDAPPVDSSPGVLSWLNKLEARMDGKLGVESEAIDRERSEDKKPVSWLEELTMALLWASGVMNTSCFATGFLGWEFGLSLKQSILVVIFASILGGALTGFCATFGGATGLRQISVSRYSFGWWANKVPALLNGIQQLGWAAVSCITGGLALTAVSDGRVSLILGIVILAVVALFISFIGLNAILVYERYAWMIFFVIFMIIYGETGHYADNKSPATAEGLTLSGSVLSLLAVVYGSSASWCTMASDYYVHYPANVNRAKVFLLTTFGIALPTCIPMIAGCVVASAFQHKPEWQSAYEDQGLGYLIQDMLYPRGFAKFLLTLLVLSGINQNVISIYSAAISFQQLARPFARIPRFLWTIFSFACILALAVGGRAKLNVISKISSVCSVTGVRVTPSSCSRSISSFARANSRIMIWKDGTIRPGYLSVLLQQCHFVSGL